MLAAAGTERNVAVKTSQWILACLAVLCATTLAAATRTWSGTVNANQNVTFTATVTPDSGTGTPTGYVTFLLDFAPLATVPLNASGVATFTTNVFPVGSNDITAFYSGGGSLADSVDFLTQVVLISSAIPTLDGRALALLAIALAACGAMFLKNH